MKNYLLFLLNLLLSFSIYAQNRAITVNYKRQSDNSVDFNYTKKAPGSYTVKLTFTNLKNAYANNYFGVVKYSSGILASLDPINKNRGITFGYKVSYIQGVLNPKKIDKNFVYLLPFKQNAELKVQELTNLGQNYLGHKAPKNWKSYQFITKSDTVYAIRKGLVIKVENRLDITTDNNIYSSDHNNILVENLDGSFTNYSNFKKNGILVKPGQYIYPHSKIGILPTKKTNASCYLYLSTYYLSDFKFDKKKTSFSNYESPLIYIVPIFATSTGNKTLQPNTTYVSVFNEDLFKKELTKREKRRLKKGSLL